MKASIIIPTFNALDFTKVCLYSLRLATRFPHEIIVVDNGSTDGTREYIETQEDVKLIKTKSNLGYAGACNLGISSTDSEYIVISNNDVMFTPYWLTRLIHTSNLDPTFAVVGPITNHAAGLHVQPFAPYENHTGLILESQRLYKQNRGSILRVSALVFFCTLIKRKTIEAVGVLDPDLGLGGCDDFDYSFRVNMAGLSCVLDKSVFIHHFCSRTFKGNHFDYWKLGQESIDLYNKKWLGISRIGTTLKP